jgi:hypothetical protein
MTGDKPLPDVTGDYLPCPVCAARLRARIPVDWWLDIAGRLTRDGAVTTITPHQPGCTRPPVVPELGWAIRVPGAAVAWLDLPPDDAGWCCECGESFPTEDALLLHRAAARLAAALANPVPPMHGVN